MSIFSAVVLDANPLAFEPVPVYNNPESSPNQQIPPHSTWAAMVEGALEYCRLAYALCPKETGSVALTVAEKKPNKIPGSYNALPHIQQGLATVRQREPTNGNQDAIGSAIAKAMDSVSPRTHQLHLIVLLMQTQSDEENTFLYRDTGGGQVNDMRYAVLEAHRKITMKQLVSRNNKVVPQF
ncbi:hypothetical protein BCR43DRAFT_510467 [Syncephalastrum racemosum]|uniref:Uncharacterized protein n=1 Tax=Syncephalastrum racemosum TaxID=13706 RepID=A0A1X2HV15_SYNRA|nr:hypothetical protein BCR43DRAFT_510467 [Syncephalastrum racemosum]